MVITTGQLKKLLRLLWTNNQTNTIFFKDELVLCMLRLSFFKKSKQGTDKYVNVMEVSFCKLHGLCKDITNFKYNWSRAWHTDFDNRLYRLPDLDVTLMVDTAAPRGMIMSSSLVYPWVHCTSSPLVYLFSSKGLILTNMLQYFCHCEMVSIKFV
jgi:hypothetical protein